MRTDGKIFVMAVVLACVSLHDPVMGQRGGERGGRPSMPGARGPVPGPQGRPSGGSPGFMAPPSRGSFGGPTGSPFSGNPYSRPDSGPSHNAPVQSTRFGPVPPSGERTMPYDNSHRMPENVPNMGPQRGGPSPSDTSRMQQALRQRDYEAIGRESQGIRNNAERIDRLGSELPMQDRLKLPLINKMYRQGTDLVDEGRNKQDESKIRMGIQQIDEANERLNRLEGSMRDRGSQTRPDHNGGHRGR